MSTKKEVEEFEKLYKKGLEAGMKAGSETVPVPMVVQQVEGGFAGIPETPVGPEYFEPDGVCGLAWVIVRPATSKFAKWLKAKGLGHYDDYRHGMIISASRYFSQSMTRKEAWAEAFAAVLREAGIRAYSESRMD